MPINQQFKNQNLRNITVDDLSKNIYRIIPINHLELMLANSTLALAKTSSWEDVYENFFFKEKFTLNGDRVTMEHLGLIIYGQCWSLFKDSDAMWRIYSQDKKSVRIQTTIGKLFDSVYVDDHCMASTYIGSVDYTAKKDLEQWAVNNSPISVSDLNKVMVESLFIKRNNFSHEKEVRVIYQPDTKVDTTQALKIYQINTNDFLEKITFDPRADDSFMDSAMQMISKYNYPRNRVNKSSLYDFTQVSIELQ